GTGQRPIGSQPDCRIGRTRISWAVSRRKREPGESRNEAAAARDSESSVPSAYLTWSEVDLAMPSVLIGPQLLRNVPGRFRDILREAGFETIDPQGGPALSEAELRPWLPRIDAMIAGGERMTPELFAIAPSLRVIARTGVG